MSMSELMASAAFTVRDKSMTVCSLKVLHSKDLFAPATFKPWLWPHLHRSISISSEALARVALLVGVDSSIPMLNRLKPVLAAAGLAAGLPPEMLMVPAAMSASCAFMLPVATAPNSVVFGSGLVTTARMAREGVLLNLLGVLVIGTVCYVSLG